MISWGQKNRAGDRESGGRNAKSTPDADLVRAARRGDKRAFVEIVARHQAMVCGIAYSILGDFAASEDAAQEAFLTAWRKFHDLREPEKLRSWLGQIARNSALGHYRRIRGHDALDEAAALADEAPTPDQVTASAEEAALVRDSLSKLPETYRTPLVLYYREGQSVRAVAETLAITEDAVKQRLARGREMMREQMSGLVESVLKRTTPTAVFTMTIAAAIGALVTPAAIAGAIFTAGSTAASTTSTSALSSQIITAMSTTKTCIITATLVAAVCIPVGYHVATNHPTAHSNVAESQVQSAGKAEAEKLPPRFENSAIFAEWRKLHDIHGTTAESMPAIYDAIAAIQDPFRRRAFRAALIAEWVRVDAPGGFAFLATQRDTSQRRQLFQEWLALDAPAAVEGLMASGPGWEQTARDSLIEIAQKVPGRIAEIIPHLPPPNNNFWDTKVREAIAVVASKDLQAARAFAEALTGPHREQALAGVAQAWAKNDLNGAIAWAKALPSGTDRDEVIRGALFGKAAVDPASALEQLGIVPPGGRQGYFATTTGARVLKEAAQANYDATVAWIAAHRGRLGHEDMMGIANAVTERLNADPAAFLNKHSADNTLLGIMPAINSALLNEGGGQRPAVWEWLKTQPDNALTKELRQQVLSAAGYQDPVSAMRFAADLPKTPEGDEQIQIVARSLFNGGSMLNRFDKLLAQAPERLQRPMIQNAFDYLREDTFQDPQTWIQRLSLLPEDNRARGAESIANAWAAQSPGQAAAWVNALPTGETRSSAMSAVVANWAAKDARGAAEWVSSLPGTDRERSAGSLVMALAEKHQREALDWIMTISDADERHRIAARTAGQLSLRDPAAARQWIEAAPLTPELREQLQSSLQRSQTEAPK
jgi:RNA polymerase sigma factor (sigma-70 family)